MDFRVHQVILVEQDHLVLMEKMAKSDPQDLQDLQDLKENVARLDRPDLQAKMEHQVTTDKMELPVIGEILDLRV